MACWPNGRLTTNQEIAVLRLLEDTLPDLRYRLAITTSVIRSPSFTSCLQNTAADLIAVGMPFDYIEYQKKCDSLTTEELQKEWENYTRQISGGATSTAASVLLGPATGGVSLLGLGFSGPRIHNARKKREIIEASLKTQGATHHTRKRDVLGPMAVAGAVGGVTMGLAGSGLDAGVVATGAVVEHKYDEHQKKKGEQKLQSQQQQSNTQNTQGQASLDSGAPPSGESQPGMQTSISNTTYSYHGSQISMSQTIVQNQTTETQQQSQPLSKWHTPVVYDDYDDYDEYGEYDDEPVSTPLNLQQQPAPPSIPITAPLKLQQHPPPLPIRNQNQTSLQNDVPTTAPLNLQQNPPPPPPRNQNQTSLQNGVEPPPQYQQDEKISVLTQPTTQTINTFSSIQVHMATISTTSTPPPITSYLVTSYPPEKKSEYTTEICELEGDSDIALPTSSYAAECEEKIFIEETPAPPETSGTKYAPYKSTLPPSFIQELPGDNVLESEPLEDETLVALTVEEEIMLLKAQLVQLELEKRKGDGANSSQKPKPEIHNEPGISPNSRSILDSPQSPTNQHQYFPHAPPPLVINKPIRPLYPQRTETQNYERPQKPHRQSTSFNWVPESSTPQDDSQEHDYLPHAPAPLSAPSKPTLAPPYPLQATETENQNKPDSTTTVVVSVTQNVTNVTSYEETHQHDTLPHAPAPPVEGKPLTPPPPKQTATTTQKPPAPHRQSTAFAWVPPESSTSNNDGEHDSLPHAPAPPGAGKPVTPPPQSSDAASQRPQAPYRQSTAFAWVHESSIQSTDSKQDHGDRPSQAPYPTEDKPTATPPPQASEGENNNSRPRPHRQSTTFAWVAEGSTPNDHGQHDDGDQLPHAPYPTVVDKPSSTPPPQANETQNPNNRADHIGKANEIENHNSRPRPHRQSTAFSWVPPSPAVPDSVDEHDDLPHAPPPNITTHSVVISQLVVTSQSVGETEAHISPQKPHKQRPSVTFASDIPEHDTADNQDSLPHFPPPKPSDKPTTATEPTSISAHDNSQHEALDDHDILPHFPPPATNQLSSTPPPITESETHSSPPKPEVQNFAWASEISVQTEIIQQEHLPHFPPPNPAGQSTAEIAEPQTHSNPPSPHRPSSAFAWAPETPVQSEAPYPEEHLPHFPPPILADQSAEIPPPETEHEAHSNPQTPHRPTPAFAWVPDGPVAYPSEDQQEHLPHFPPPLSTNHNQEGPPPAEDFHQSVPENFHKPSEASTWTTESTSFTWNSENPSPGDHDEEPGNQHEYFPHAPSPVHQPTTTPSPRPENHRPESISIVFPPHKPSPASAWESGPDPSQQHQYFPHAPPPEATSQAATPQSSGSQTTPTAPASSHQNLGQEHQYVPYCPPTVETYETVSSQTQASVLISQSIQQNTTPASATSPSSGQQNQYLPYAPPQPAGVSKPEQTTPQQEEPQKPENPPVMVSHLFPSIPPPHNTPPIVTTLLANPPSPKPSPPIITSLLSSADEIDFNHSPPSVMTSLFSSGYTNPTPVTKATTPPLPPAGPPLNFRPLTTSTPTPPAGPPPDWKPPPTSTSPPSPQGPPPNWTPTATSTSPPPPSRPPPNWVPPPASTSPPPPQGPPPNWVPPATFTSPPPEQGPPPNFTASTPTPTQSPGPPPGQQYQATQDTPNYGTQQQPAPQHQTAQDFSNYDSHPQSPPPPYQPPQNIPNYGTQQQPASQYQSAQNAPNYGAQMQTIAPQNHQPQAPSIVTATPQYQHNPQGFSGYAPRPSISRMSYVVSPMSSPAPQYSNIQPPPTPFSPQPRPGQASFSSYQPSSYPPRPPVTPQPQPQHQANSSISYAPQQVMNPPQMSYGSLSAMSPPPQAGSYNPGSMQYQPSRFTASPAPMTPHPGQQMYQAAPPTPAPGIAPGNVYYVQAQPQPQPQYQQAPNPGHGQFGMQPVQNIQWAPQNPQQVVFNQPNYGLPPPIPQPWRGRKFGIRIN
ncbi:hypothetical protein G7Y89_g11142 [Cudoniella acicularis]|uniref:Uncharacterized protein n=1 Tax=Cudoniella acicularis TaxID=354080 RepID=A0A8H4RDP6_9HELO|nr:hypothetical protein G7Y89_g11142 [Cudoniella acicularis]